MQLRRSVDAPIDHDIIKETRITLVAKHPYALVSLEREEEDWDQHYIPTNAALHGIVTNSDLTLSASLRDWEATIEHERHEEFNKLEEVYGYDKALEIFRVLRGSK